VLARCAQFEVRKGCMCMKNTRHNSLIGPMVVALDGIYINLRRLSGDASSVISVPYRIRLGNMSSSKTAGNEEHLSSRGNSKGVCKLLFRNQCQERLAESPFHRRPRAEKLNP
jgi:hypothetical protein